MLALDDHRHRRRDVVARLNGKIALEIPRILTSRKVYVALKRPHISVHPLEYREVSHPLRAELRLELIVSDALGGQELREGRPVIAHVLTSLRLTFWLLPSLAISSSLCR